jgi:hypothetical protein
MLEVERKVHGMKLYFSLLAGPARTGKTCQIPINFSYN